MARVDGVDAGARSPADVVFAVLVVVAGPVIAWTNRDQWFHGDEFAFAFKRSLAEPASWFEPHWGHLVALPVVLYQALFELIGLHHYWPYQWLVIGAHLAVVVLARRLMRLADVDPWLATAVATVLLFLGAGRENLAWGFQVTLTGSLVFGLGALVVLAGPGGADRSGRRWAAGLLVGAVLCSNVGVVMVAVAALTVLLVERASLERPAQVVGRVLEVAGPATAVVLVWRVLAPDSEYGVPTAAPAEAVRFAVRALGAAATGYAQLLPVAVVLVLVVLLVPAAVVAGARPDRLGDAVRASMALAVGTVAAALLLGHARAADVFVRPDTGRYVYLLVALGVVPLAVVVDRLVRGRGPVVLALACVVLLAGLPGNLARLGPSTDLDRDRSGNPAEVVHMADLLTRDQVEPLADDEVIVGEITAGGLRDAQREGRLPSVAIPEEAAARGTLLVALRSGDPGADVGAGDDQCVPVDGGQPVALDVGDRLVFRDQLTVHLASDEDRAGGITVAVPEGTEGAIDVRWGPIEVVLESGIGPGAGSGPDAGSSPMIRRCH